MTSWLCTDICNKTNRAYNFVSLPYIHINDFTNTSTCLFTLNVHTNLVQILNITIPYLTQKLYFFLMILQGSRRADKHIHVKGYWLIVNLLMFQNTRWWHSQYQFFAYTISSVMLEVKYLKYKKSNNRVGRADQTKQDLV